MRAYHIAALGAALLLATLAQAQAPVVNVTVRGKVVRVAPTNDFFVVQTSDGREVTLYPNPQTNYRLGRKALQFRDLRTDVNVSAVYDVRDARNVVNTVTWVETPAVATPPVTAPAPGAQPAPAPGTQPAPAAQPATPGTTIEGTIVRIEGTDQFVVRTADGREMILYAQPQTVYRIDDQVVKYQDFKQGMPVTVIYETRERRPVIRTLLGGPRRIR